MNHFSPHLEILPAPQRALWNELSEVSREFVLYGGTALALHLAHRESVDFDLFGSRALDLAGIKASVVQVRAEAKDYIDIDALITVGKVDLPLALSAAQGLYGSTFNPQITLKALSFFNDGDLTLLPEDMAYAMTYARHEDMRVIREYVSDEDFREALDRAPPGIIDPRSWAYWNSKMGRYPPPPLPKRHFGDDEAPRAMGGCYDP
jgi:hypothetical protein